MKRFGISIIIIIVCFLLQSTVFNVFVLADVVPNLLLIVTVATAYIRGKKEGLITGLLCGLLVDLVFGNFIGLYGLMYMIIGYLNGFCNKIYYKDDFTIPIILVGVSDFIYNFMIYTFEFLLRSRLNLFFYIRRIILPEVVYTLVVSIFLYKILHSINQKLEGSEKRRLNID